MNGIHEVTGSNPVSSTMSYYVYILRSKPTGRYYTGYTKDIDERLRRHNAGHSSSTKPYRPWEVVHTEEYPTRSAAMQRENEIKSKKSREYIDRLINNSEDK